MGLDVYLKVDDEYIEFPSKKYPDHSFKVGYFRSSYNESGINYVLWSRGLPDLWEIFDAKSGEFVPDWEKSLERAKQLLADLRRSYEELPFGVSYMPVVSCNVEDPKKAFEVFKRYKERKAPFDSFINKDGFFFMKEPVQVHAIIPGKGTIFIIHSIVDAHVAFYTQAVEIVVETIEYVLGEDSPAPSLHKLHWCD